jgi:response regulator of citrate/malate metabolism
MALETVLEKVQVEQSALQEPKSLERETVQQVRLIGGSELKELDILQVIGDEYARAILLSIIDNPKSAIDIAREQKIPISSIYRKIHWLENARMIRVKGFVITGDGKKYHLYQSKIKSIQISLPKYEIRVEFVNNNGSS